METPLLVVALMVLVVFTETTSQGGGGGGGAGMPVHLQVVLVVVDLAGGGWIKDLTHITDTGLRKCISLPGGNRYGTGGAGNPRKLEPLIRGGGGGGAVQDTLVLANAVYLRRRVVLVDLDN